MRITIKTYILLATISSFSCSNNLGNNFEIKNDTSFEIDSVIVTNGIHQVKLKELKANEKRIGFIDFKIGNPKHDGNYEVKVYNKKQRLKELFGYYSNGMPSNSEFEIILKKDTIVINEIINH